MRALVIKVRQRAAQNAGGYISKGELSDEKLRRLNGWYDDSYRHEAFGALAARVLAASDLSQLYFRELYLDMTRQVQFPVDLNLPLLLLSHVAGANAAEQLALLEQAMHALSIYDDAWAVALQRIQPYLTPYALHPDTHTQDRPRHLCHMLSRICGAV